MHNEKDYRTFNDKKYDFMYKHRIKIILLSFIYSDTDYLIIPINHKKAPKFTLDILILDNYYL